MNIVGVNMDISASAVEFGKVRDFKGFLGDLLAVLNMPKVLDLLDRGIRKISFVLDYHKIRFASVKGLITTASEETWSVIGDNNKKIGWIKAMFVDEHFFLFGDGYKLLNFDLLEKIFVLKEDKKDSKEAQKIIINEKNKVIKYLKGEVKKLEIDPNLALVIREWMIPIEPIKFYISDDVANEFKRFVNKLAESYSNDYPLPGIGDIIENVKVVEDTVYEGYDKFKLDWSKLIKKEG